MVLAVPPQGGVLALPVSPYLTVDQFGWLPGQKKIAVLASPVKGQNAGQPFTPSGRFETRRIADGATLFSGTAPPWRNGAVAEIAGDRVWHADFSTLREPGEYVLVDPVRRVRSHVFRIHPEVYKQVLVDAVRVFLFQRSGTPLLARHVGEWAHPGGHLGPNQDRAAQYTQGGTARGSPRNLLGGWYDAGDLTKYIPFTRDTLFDLLWAYERNPKAFGDATNIPESGNGVPDLLDEVKWELDWMLKMQDADGGVFNRNGGRSHDNGKGPPNSDVQPRFYTAKTTWATATFAGVCAHAARTFAPFDKQLPGYSRRLREAALKAWEYLQKHPRMDPPDGTDGDSTIVSAQASSDVNADRRDRVYAAAELFATTGERRFADYVERWAPDIEATQERDIHPLKQQVDPLNALALTKGLFVYAGVPGADASLVRRFKDSLRAAAEMIRANTNGPDDPYLCYHYADHYCWGSNSVKGRWARVLLMAMALGVEPGQHAAYRDVVAGYLHYLHGRNPLGWCYLTNMNHAGADRCITRIYHKWFSTLPDKPDGSRPLPAPGYLAGGPNRFFTVDWIRPPYGEPPMKAYRDWDGAWNAQRQANESSWEITEPAIYYQAAYVLMLAHFAPGGMWGK